MTFCCLCGRLLSAFYGLLKCQIGNSQIAPPPPAPPPLLSSPLCSSLSAWSGMHPGRTLHLAPDVWALSGSCLRAAFDLFSPFRPSSVFAKRGERGSGWGAVIERHRADQRPDQKEALYGPPLFCWSALLKQQIRASLRHIQTLTHIHTHTYKHSLTHTHTIVEQLGFIINPIHHLISVYLHKKIKIISLLAD